MLNVTAESLQVLNDLRDVVSANAKEKGFRDQLVEGLTEEQKNSPIAKLVLMATFTSNQHGETSELWEAFRNGSINEPCDKAQKMVGMGLPPLTCGEEEIADELIRCLDKAEALGIDVAKAVAAKHAYNRSRPKLHGGKKA